MVLRPNSLPPVQGQSALLDKPPEKDTNSFPQGYFIAPKGKRGQEEEYFTSVSSRKGSGVVNIKLPYYGTVAGMNYEVRWVECSEFLSICSCPRMKIDQVRLLEDPSTATYSKTVQQLLEQKPQGGKYPPAVDPVKGT